MTSREKYLSGYALPHELVELIEFDIKFGAREYYSAGFELKADPDESGLHTYSQAPAFLSRLVSFATADETGSYYAFWLRNDTKDLACAPVVIFGGEGGYHLVAKNFRELMEILVQDAEPLVSWDEVSYTTDLSNNGLPAQFAVWAREKLHVEASVLADEIVSNAQRELAQEFHDFMRSFVA
jgi:hypothetical protein